MNVVEEQAFGSILRMTPSQAREALTTAQKMFTEPVIIATNERLIPALEGTPDDVPTVNVARMTVQQPHEGTAIADAWGRAAGSYDWWFRQLRDAWMTRQVRAIGVQLTEIPDGCELDTIAFYVKQRVDALRDLWSAE